MPKSRALGRGLDALLGGPSDPSSAFSMRNDRLATLRLSLLQPGRYQPRTNMHDEAILELADSIRAQGLIQPILVRPVGGDRYEIIAGERRWRAAQHAGLEEVPVVVRHVNDEAALAMALVENIQREDLNAIEEATGLQRLIDEFGMTHQQAATAVGRSRAAVSNLLRLLELPQQIKDLLARGDLDMGHGRALLALPAEQQLPIALAATENSWSVRDVERRVAGLLKDRSEPRPEPNKSDTDVSRLETELSDLLNTRVEITHGKRANTGRLLISYESLDQLDGILIRLKALQHCGN